jgi:2-C-methyl-D-erythritol 4-phosphate cytidylyltransferase
MAKTVAIILAGGSGQRVLYSQLPKQLINVQGKHLINYCLDIYQTIDEIDSIVLVINESFRRDFEKVVREGRYNKIQSLVRGGMSRQESIYNGIKHIRTCDFVVIQNGVSILTPMSLVRECLEVARKHGAASAFVREIYSSFTINGNRIGKSIDRNSLGHVRDPQVFLFELLAEAHKWAIDEGIKFTNDVALVREYGREVYLVESPLDNFKITSDMDLELAASILKKRSASA